MALQSPVFPSPGPPLQRQPQVFEFTKRKKWADILVSELPDTVILILDEEGKIQYVGANTTDLLGWNVEELSESSVLDIINDDDRKTFNNHFHHSLSSQQDLSCYTRMKCKPDSLAIEQVGTHNELLFEIRGHTLYLPNDSEFKVFFFMAKPYPSRNMAILNTFLELKVENERLTQRLKDLKAQRDVMSISSSDLSLSSSSGRSHYEFSSSRDSALVSPSTSKGGGFSTMHSGFVHSTVPSVNSRIEDDEEGGARKKLKKSNPPAQQYVCMTCGRTDSPEWRKGPRGPKTLCNACGLRWAKRSKRSDDVPIPYVQGQGGRDGQDPGRPSPPTPNLGSGRGGRGAPVVNAALSVTPTEKPPQPQPLVVSSVQQNNQQGRYDMNAPSPSPTVTSYPHTSMGPPQPPTVATHYGGVHSHVQPPMHHSGMQPSPTAPHGYVPSQAPQQQQQHYDTPYDHYPWPVNQRLEGGYGY